MFIAIAFVYLNLQTGERICKCTFSYPNGRKDGILKKLKDFGFTPNFFMVDF